MISEEQYEQVEHQNKPPAPPVILQRDYSTIANMLNLLAERQQYQSLIDPTTYKNYQDRR